jgi:hypothetical protein
VAIAASAIRLRPSRIVDAALLERKRPAGCPACSRRTRRGCSAPAVGQLGPGQCRQFTKPPTRDSRSLNDRAADAWRPLLAIAVWPENGRLGREAAVSSPGPTGASPDLCPHGFGRSRLARHL